ncbi:MAG: hypothetical protein AAF388_01875 [Bacteroidota bacterium]
MRKLIIIILMGLTLYWWIEAPEEPRKTLIHDLKVIEQEITKPKPKSAWDMMDWKMRREAYLPTLK